VLVHERPTGAIVAAFDVVAACAGLPYGLAQAAHIVEAAGCAVLLVLAEKFSDKLGTVRSSRMLFGDGAAAMLLIPARRGLGDVELVQTYAGGSRDELAAIAWPDPDFNNHLTVQGPGARSIVERYLAEILRELPGSTAGAPLPAGADVIVPHQANERMVRELSEAAGIPGSALYFNVASVGNLSAASIPVAIYDGVQGGAISNDTRVLTPAFGAGAVAGVALIKLREPVVDAIKHAQNSGVGIAGPAAPRDPEPGGRMPAHNQAAAEV
jgi:3-oxoacyl-[acyl-carrier-protein] synthase-3